jgi:Zn-dependent M28 family amino/carboxypeptidase
MKVGFSGASPTLLILASTLALAAAPARPPGRALQAISADGLLRHIRVLSSDALDGRAPGTPGEEKTVQYLIDQFKALGLMAGNPDGTYVQTVPLVGFTTAAQAAYRIGNQRTTLVTPTECVAWSRRLAPEVRVDDSEMVFVGYGVVAPEYEWDDFKGLDVRGKTLVMLVGDPPAPDPNDPAKLDPRVFKGRAMTYYGRWTYKYEVAAARGAAAAIIVHETGPAGYPWSVVVGSNTREHLELRTADQGSNAVAVESWIPVEQARTLFAKAGADYDRLKQVALSREFQPAPLGIQASFTVRSTLREVESRNVIARLEGGDPQLKDQCIVYTAHWDHLGRDEALPGDQVYNGAVDNGTGLGALLEIAKAFTQLNRPPRRSVLFLAVTAEEKGLLGAQHYVRHPLYPLARTLANLNMDAMNPYGRTRDLEIIGDGNTTIEDVVAAVAAAQGRRVTGDAEPEKGHYYRSDHFEFAKAGVPALLLKGGIDYVGRPKDFGLKKSEEYTALDYHRVSDEIKPDWDLRGLAEDARLLFHTGWLLTRADRWPEWKPGAEFRAKREAMLKAAPARTLR